MADFSVWAPSAARLDLSVRARAFPMTRGGDGWWTATVAAAGPGDDYTFALDGGPPLPDPRSPWQPQGVAGPSRLVDHRAFRWTDAGFQARPLAAAVHLRAARRHVHARGARSRRVIGQLDHLRDLGVTHVELMPVAEFPGRSAGATTASHSMRRDTSTAARPGSSGWSTPATRRASA